MEMKKNKDKADARPSASFFMGVIALVFLIAGYQTALFVHKTAVTEIISQTRDTVYIFLQQEDSIPATATTATEYTEQTKRGNARVKGYTAQTKRGNAWANRGGQAGPDATKARKESIREQFGERRVESFRFNPNTVTVAELMRLGFSRKQAESIESYREKGGKFRRPSDFARSYVVADSVYKRLEKYIDIPLLDINRADSAAFDSLPGIGPYFASKMVEYRDKLGGYSYKEQLMDIWKLDREKFDALADLITLSPARPYPLWTAPEDSLKLHPYIRNWRTAHAIVLFRENTPREQRTVEEMKKAGILDPDLADKLSKCLIAE